MDDRSRDLSPADDERLMAAYVAGDRAAFAELVRRHEQDLSRFLRRFVGDAAAADDVFQEAFLQVHRSAGSFDPGKSFRPWLFTIAANKARDLLRSRARRRVLSIDRPAASGDRVSSLADGFETPWPSPVAVAQSAETRARVAATVEALPAIHREVLRLAYFRQLPYRQIGRSLGLPLGTVKSRLHVAVKAFAAAWGAEHGPLDPTRN